MKKFGVLFLMFCVMFGSLTVTSEIFAREHDASFMISVPVESEVFHEKAKGSGSQKGISWGFGIRLFKSDNVKLYFGLTDLKFSLIPKTEDAVQPESATFLSGDLGVIFYPAILRDLSVLFAVSRGHGVIYLKDRSTGIRTGVPYDAFGLKFGLGIEVSDTLALTMGVQTIGDRVSGFLSGDSDIKARVYFFGLRFTR